MDNKAKGALILALALAIPVLILLNYDAISGYEWGALGYVGVFIVMLLTSATVILPVPGLALATIAGAFANPILIGIAGGLGSAIGELTGYFIGYGGIDVVDGKKIKEYEKIKSRLMEKDRAFLLIFTLALIPNPLFDVAGIAAGAIKYPYWKYLAACALGKIIKVGVFAYLGYLAAAAIL
ncbi:MAG: VTT domain-containing protein [Candidatus Micrarchaeota archaeon]|nr:VTT domain-containing protein [Candidatus Micrarchaeota archaeon]